MKVIEQLHRNCDSTPTALEIINGISHFSDKKEFQHQRWDIVRAYASQKMHYLAWLRLDFNVPLEAKSALASAWPHLKRGSAGDPQVVCLPRHSAAWKVLREEFGIKSVPDFLKHLFTKHDGEVRLIQDNGWKRLEPAHALHPRFWHSQFSRSLDARVWLSNRKPDQPITWSQAAWVLDQDGGQTTLLRRAPASAASGARPPWQEDFPMELRVGQVVTLAHLFFLGAGFCSAYDMYKLYMDLPLLVHRRMREAAPDRVLLPTMMKWRRTV